MSHRRHSTDDFYVNPEKIVCYVSRRARRPPASAPRALLNARARSRPAPGSNRFVASGAVVVARFRAARALFGRALEEERAPSPSFRESPAVFSPEVSASSGSGSAGGAAGESAAAAGDATVSSGDTAGGDRLDATVATVSSHDAVSSREAVCASSAANGSKAPSPPSAKALFRRWNDAPSRPSIQSTVRWNQVAGGSPEAAATRRSRHADLMLRLKVFVTIWPAWPGRGDVGSGASVVVRAGRGGVPTGGSDRRFGLGSAHAPSAGAGHSRSSAHTATSAGRRASAPMRWRSAVERQTPTTANARENEEAGVVTFVWRKNTRHL